MQTNKNLFRFAAFALVTGSMSLGAIADTTTAATITTLGEEIAVLRLQERKAQFEAKIEELKRQKEGGVSATMPNGMPMAAPPMNMPGAPMAAGEKVSQFVEPTVIGISIMGKTALATLRFANGGQKDVMHGDAIEGGYKVTKITSSGVEITKGGEATWLSPSSR